jgi:lipopolysaccharide/colanic/teichoic acid biosynthesis glycosyltransferase
MAEPVILLDLNSTYAANASQVHVMQRGIYNVQQEFYRSWLTAMLRHRTVVMLTSRPSKYQEETMKRIFDIEGWTPGLAVFNAWFLPASDAKLKMLRDTVYPLFGEPVPGRYVAIESNIKTRAMFKQQAIPAYTQQEVQRDPLLLLPLLQDDPCEQAVLF